MGRPLKNPGNLTDRQKKSRRYYLKYREKILKAKAVLSANDPVLIGKRKLLALARAYDFVVPDTLLDAVMEGVNYGEGR